MIRKYPHPLMMLTFAAWAISSAAPKSSLAESAGLTLDDVLRLANSNTTDRVIIDQQRDQGLAQIDKITADALPLITSEVTATRSSSPSSSSGLGGQGGSQGQGTGSQSVGAFPDRIYSSTYNWNVNLRTPLVSFGRLGTLNQIAKDQEDFLRLTNLSQVQGYYLKVISAYNDALLRLNFHEAAVRSEDHARSVFEFTDLEYQTGGRSRVDLLRVKSSLSLAEAATYKALSEKNSSLARLKMILGIQEEKSFKIRPGVQYQPRFMSQVQSDRLNPSKRREISAKEQQVKVAEGYVSYSRNTVWPTLYLVSGVRSQVYQADFGVYKTDEDAQPHDIFGANRFNYSIGLALNWTLFDGFRRTAETRENAAKAAIARAELQQLRQETNILLDEAKDTFKVTSISLKASLKAREAVQIAVDQIESDYKAGTASLSEVLEVQDQLWEAEKRVYESYAARILAAANLTLVAGKDLVVGD